MLSDKLSDTALNLIEKYGNDVVLTIEMQDGTYDPITDSFNTTINTINTKGVYRKPRYGEDKSVTNIVKIPYNADVTVDYLLDGNAIIAIEPIKVQNKIIVMDIYI
jgi:hypothetical protein